MKYLLQLVLIACVVCNPSAKEETKVKNDTVEVTATSSIFLEDKTRIKSIVENLSEFL